MCQLLLFCLNLFVFISALKINNFAASGEKKINYTAVQSLPYLETVSEYKIQTG